MSPAKRKCCALVLSLNIGNNGPSVAIKDCIDIAGTVTACGSKALTSNPAAKAHANVVNTLLDSGCNIIGKANMHELAYGMTGVNMAFGTPINPQWPDRIPGGSSSGSAVAVAKGLCDFAVGTDTGGSVRQPAICCGLYGIKPSFGRISRAGCSPAQSSLDCIGAIAPNAAMLTEAMALMDPSFEAERITAAPRVACVQCDVEQQLGEALHFAIMDDLPNAAYISLPHMEQAFQAGMTLIAAEAAEAYGHLLEGDQPLGPDVRQRLEAAREIGATDIAEAEAMREIFTAEIDAALAEHDVLMTPALPIVVPTLEAARYPSSVLPLTKFLRPFNLSGHPAIVLPISIGPEALPAGIQIIGRKGADAQLCAIAEWLAATMPVFQRDILKEESL